MEAPFPIKDLNRVRSYWSLRLMCAQELHSIESLPDDINPFGKLEVGETPT